MKKQREIEVRERRKEREQERRQAKLAKGGKR